MWTNNFTKKSESATYPPTGRILLAIGGTIIAVSTLMPTTVATSARASHNADTIQIQSNPPHPRTLRAVAQPRQAVTLGVPFDGILSTIEVKEGDRVRKGQIVARMDSQVAEADLEIARIEADRTGPIRRAEATLKAATRKLEEINNAFTQGGASTHEQLDAEETFERVAAELVMANEVQAVARARFNTELVELEQHNVRAPFDGIVTFIEIEIGSSLIRGQPILHLIAPEVLEAELNLPLDYYETLEIGRSYSFLADQPVNRTLNAKLVFIDVTVNSASQTFKCLFRFDNHSTNLPVGFAVELQTGTDGPVIVMAEEKGEMRE